MRDKTWELARGRWREILPYLGVSKKFLTGKNMACPVCGGKDRFRFTDRRKDGDYFCNQCGAGKGFKLIMLVNGWDFKTAAKAVDDALGYRPVKAEPMSKAHRAARAFFDSCPDLPSLWEPPKSTADATRWLLKHQPEKLPEWLSKHDPMLEVWINRKSTP